MCQQIQDRRKRSAELLQSYLTSAAIVIGGLYALYQAWIHRDTWQLANIEQSVESHRVSASLVWLTTSVKIRNDGKVLLHLKKAKFIIYRVAPVLAQALSSESNETIRFTGEGRIIDWPVLCRYERAINFMLEPTESDVLTLDALIPASIHTVKVFTYLGDSDDDQNGWERATVYELPKEGEHDASKVGNSDGGTLPVCPHSN